jgi:hypothetical protein
LRIVYEPPISSFVKLGLQYPKTNITVADYSIMLSFLCFFAFQVVLLAAWVSGTLDPYQKKLQEFLLDCMGENKVSYGLKSTGTTKRK